MQIDEHHPSAAGVTFRGELLTEMSRCELEEACVLLGRQLCNTQIAALDAVADMRRSLSRR